MAFGITPPQAKHRRTAALFINIVLFATLLCVLALFLVMIKQLLAH